MIFSIEVTPKTDVSELPRSIREVSITFLPGARYQKIIDQAVRLKQLGFDRIPHIPTCSIPNRQAFVLVSLSVSL
ncbi:MAG: hypothetical protein WA783_01850 [Phormidesmis sp.]